MHSSLGGGAITRYFAQLDSVLMSYLSYANTLVFANGDTDEFKFLAPIANVATSEYLTDGDINDATRGYCVFESNGTITLGSPVASIEIDGVPATTYPTDGKEHTAKLTFNGVGRIKYRGCRYTISSFYNGILSDAAPSISGVTIFNEIGAALLGGNSESSVTTGAANSLDPSLIPDANIEQYTLIDGSWIGEELVVITMVDSAPIGSGTTTINTFTAMTGNSYIIGATIANYLGSGDVGYSTVGGIPATVRRDSNGIIEGEFAAISDANIRLFALNTNQCTYTGITSKRKIEIA